MLQAALKFSLRGRVKTDMAGQRDRDEFMAALYDSEYKRLYRVAFQALRDREASHDIVQEAFLLALARWEKLKDHPNPKGWLMVTLANLVKNEKRRRVYCEVPIDELFDAPARNDGQKIEDMLPAGLTEEEQKVLIWRYELMLDYQEIAERLGISESGCRSKVSRAVSRCRELLKNE